MNCNRDLDYDWFQPLVCRRDVNLSSYKTALAVPVVDHDVSPLPVRCFLKSDRMTPYCACETYLQLDELPYTTERVVNLIPCALLGETQPDVQMISPADVVMVPGTLTENEPMFMEKCTNVGCSFFGLQEYNGLCLICHQKTTSSTGFNVF